MVKTNVLGTEYKVELSDLNNHELADYDGKCFVYEKKIILRNPQYMLREGNLNDKQDRFRETLTHELIHAFCRESAVQYDTDEVWVDWMAYMIPKIVTAYDDILKQFKEDESNDNLRCC